MSPTELRLLAITAHPDDESGSFGGALALYAARGVTVEVLCATSGEAARNRGVARTPEELAELRRQEFRRACDLLGVSWRDIWDYPDGGLNRIALPEIGARLCRVIRERRPDLVLTFGPEGGFTAHADHSAISHFATFAFHAAGRKEAFPEAGPPHRPHRLYYATGRAALHGYPQVCFSPVSAEIDISETFERKLQAFECHQTQAPLFPRFRKAAQGRGPREYFHLAASDGPPAPGMDRDLLGGL